MTVCRRTIHKEILRSNALRSLCTVVLLFTEKLHAEPADLLFLTGGRILLGSLEKKQGQMVQFRPRNEETLTLQSHELTGLLLGYEGLPACLTLRSDPSVRNCSVSILALGQTFLFSDEQGQREIHPEEISEFTFQKKEKRNPILPLLHFGTEVKLQAGGAHATVRASSLEFAKLQFSDGRYLHISESDALGGRLFQPNRGFFEVARETWTHDPTLFIPGIPGFKSGKKLQGVAFMGIFAGTLLRGFYHHSQASQVVKESNNDIAYRVIGLGNYPAAFRTQVRARNTMWGLSSAVFLFHTFQTVWLRRWTPGTLELQIEPRALKMGFTFPLTSQP